MSHNLILKCNSYLKQVIGRFYRHILAICDVWKKDNDRSRNSVFICSEMNYLLNFALGKCTTCNISIKN